MSGESLALHQLDGLKNLLDPALREEVDGSEVVEGGVGGGQELRRGRRLQQPEEAPEHELQSLDLPLILEVRLFVSQPATHAGAADAEDACHLRLAAEVPRDRSELLFHGYRHTIRLRQNGASIAQQISLRKAGNRGAALDVSANERPYPSRRRSRSTKAEETMETVTVREVAERHVQAIAEGRISDALADVVEDIRTESEANLALVAPLVTTAEVESIEVDRDEATVLMRFVTRSETQPDVLIESQWWEVDGRPQLVRAAQV
jgi:hypothetical protein